MLCRATETTPKQRAPNGLSGAREFATVEGLWGSLVSYGLWEPATAVQIGPAPLRQKPGIRSQMGNSGTPDGDLSASQGFLDRPCGRPHPETRETQVRIPIEQGDKDSLGAGFRREDRAFGALHDDLLELPLLKGGGDPRRRLNGRRGELRHCDGVLAGDDPMDDRETIPPSDRDGAAAAHPRQLRENPPQFVCDPRGHGDGECTRFAQRTSP